MFVRGRLDCHTGLHHNGSARSVVMVALSDRGLASTCMRARSLRTALRANLLRGRWRKTAAVTLRCACCRNKKSFHRVARLSGTALCASHTFHPARLSASISALRYATTARARTAVRRRLSFPCDVQICERRWPRAPDSRFVERRIARETLTILISYRVLTFDPLALS